MVPSDTSPFSVFTTLVAPAILTNASTLLALSTSNRLARAVDRSRVIAEMLVHSPGPGQVGGKGADVGMTRELAHELFAGANERCRQLVVALRAYYLAVGCFAGGTCVALLGAGLDRAGEIGVAGISVIAMVLLACVGVGALVYGSVSLVAESTLTLGMLRREQASIERVIAQGPPAPVRD